jgi:hypothetical protein
MFEYPGGHLLCLNCHTTYQQTVLAQQRELARGLNFALSEMESVTGMHGVMPRYEIEQPVIRQGPTTFNNFKIDRSVVGAINTGRAHKMDVSLSNINTPESAELHDALASFTQSVMNSDEVTNNTKNAVLDLLEAITSEAAKPKEQRNQTLLTTILPKIPTLVSTATSLVALWDKIQPHLAHLVG